MSGFSAAHRGGEGPPLVLLHGFTDTWRTGELVLGALERRHRVFAPTLPGHAGGPPLPDPTAIALGDAVEGLLDAEGIERAHLVGNSLGGQLALELAARGRGLSVVALAPAGGWEPDDPAAAATDAHFRLMLQLLPQAAPAADSIAATPEGRRRATQMITVNYEHIPAQLIAHQIRGAASCPAALPLLEQRAAATWELDAARVDCPVRIAWGLEDRILPWPATARRFREDWLPHADWVEMPGVGHCPQLDVPTETAQLILGWTRP